jgi:L-lysine exporter family protein LysE/ArgO
MPEAALAGFFTGLSLILAIGAQNAFVLRQGLRREHVGPVVAVCAGSDALLIAAGVAGFGAVSAAVPWLAEAMRWAGVAFLLVYGGLRFLAARKGGEALRPAEGRSASLRAVLATCLVLTWANPHVYLDTVVLLGSISGAISGAGAGLRHRRGGGLGGVLLGAWLRGAASGAGLRPARRLGLAGDRRRPGDVDDRGGACVFLTGRVRSRPWNRKDKTAPGRGWRAPCGCCCRACAFVGVNGVVKHLGHRPASGAIGLCPLCLWRGALPADAAGDAAVGPSRAESGGCSAGGRCCMWRRWCSGSTPWRGCRWPRCRPSPS